MAAKAGAAMITATHSAFLAKRLAGVERVEMIAGAP